MSSTIKNVMIIGAGGYLGPSILSAFTADSRFTASILTRKSSKSTFPPNVKVFRVGDDYPEHELIEAFQGQDAIVSTIQNASSRVQNGIVGAAVKAGVKRFIPSEFGSDTLNENVMKILPQYFAGKKVAVEHLKTKEKDGITWTAFVTGLFFELAVTLFKGFDLKTQKATLYNDGNGTWSTTTFGSIGLAVKNALLLPDQTANQYVYVNSFTVSQNEVLASLEKATGNKWDATYVDAEKQKKLGMEKMSKGDLSDAIFLIQYINMVEGNGSNFATYTEGANRLLSLPKLDLDETIGSIVKG